MRFSTGSPPDARCSSASACGTSMPSPPRRPAERAGLSAPGLRRCLPLDARMPRPHSDESSRGIGMGRVW